MIYVVLEYVFQRGARGVLTCHSPKARSERLLRGSHTFDSSKAPLFQNQHKELPREECKLSLPVSPETHSSPKDLMLAFFASSGLVETTWFS
jgi:hypothetical protein